MEKYLDIENYSEFEKGKTILVLMDKKHKEGEFFYRRQATSLSSVELSCIEKLLIILGREIDRNPCNKFLEYIS